MTSLLAILALGFLLGMRHATDPDHVIAVSTIVSRERSIWKAGWIGALWGCGHTITIVVVGAGIILFNFVIPPRVGLTMEFSVGLMLVLLGVLNLTGALRWLSDRFAHPHVHREARSVSSVSNSSGNILGNLKSLGVFNSLRPLFIGIVHGLAGSAAVALLVLGTIRQPIWAVFYLLIFGVGTIAGMMLITGVLALPFSFAGYRFEWLNRGLITTSGLVSLAFGLFVCYQIGIVDGLFSNHPAWSPS